LTIWHCVLNDNHLTLYETFPVLYTSFSLEKLHLVGTAFPGPMRGLADSIR